jgi:BirA family transcriptional regulator, biotin operon repressor / biotin---[acetyl-CoA-carboxylase] ligase
VFFGSKWANIQMIGVKIGLPHFELEETDSTNSYASRLIHNELPKEGTAILAHYQKAGKGQRGSGWESEPRKNLLVSYILYPEFLNVADHFLFNQCLSVAVVEFLRVMTKLPVFIKWPNDIIADHKKIAGILVENTLRNNRIINSIAGIGINVNQTNFQSYSPEAVSLKMLEGKNFEVLECFEQLNKFIEKWYNLLKFGNHEKIKSAYTGALYMLEKPALFKKGSDQFKGIITGVLNDGHLIVRKENGELSYFLNKEISMVF